MTGAAQPVRSFATASVTHGAAVALVAAARATAGELGIAVAVTVTDAGGHLTAFERMDGAPFLTGEVAINKAWTAASYGVATHDWNRYIADPKVAPLANVPRLTPVGGGNPVKDGGKLVGGIGVSGGVGAWRRPGILRRVARLRRRHAVQAQLRPPSPHPEAALSGDELASLRGWAAAPRRPDVLA